MYQQHMENKSMVLCVPGNSLQSIDPKLIDIAVWEVMSDYKRRDVATLITALVARGFARNVVDRRIDALFAKKWFDRRGNGASTVYILKKSVKAPEGAQAPVLSAADAGKANIQIGEVKNAVIRPAGPLVLDGARGMSVRELSMRTGVTMSKIYRALEDEGINADDDTVIEKITIRDLCIRFGISVTTAAAPVTTTEQPQKKEEQQMEVKDQTQDISTPTAVILSVMADGEEYSIAGLEDAIDGLTVPQLRWYMSQLVKKGQVDKFEHSPRHHTYKLKNVAPKQEQSTQGDLLEEVAPAAPVSAVQQAMQEVADEVAKIKAEVKLLDIEIRIKGNSYTVDDARELAKELYGNGFGEDSTSDNGLKFLKVSMEIRGVPFTMAEANELTQQLIERGIYVPPAVPQE